MCGRTDLSKARRVFLLGFVAALLIAWAGFVAAPAVAQEREPATRQGQPERRHRPRDHHGQPGPGGERGPGLHLGHLPGADLFQQLPEDEGPLTPGEGLELLAFLRAHVPWVCRSLEQLGEHDPAALEQRLQEAAPRLRQLRRIFERDPELGAQVVRYSENLHRIRRARWAWRNSEDPEARQGIRAAVRRTIAQNLRIEALVLDDRTRQLAEQRDERIEAWVDRMRSDDFDAAGESEDVRELVQAWRAAETDDERAELEAELREICAEQIDRELARLSNRAALIRENLVDEVDQRMQRWVEQAERGPRTRPAPKRDREGTGGEKGGHDRLPGPRP
jgi:hypothetical protein